MPRGVEGSARRKFIVAVGCTPVGKQKGGGGASVGGTSVEANNGAVGTAHADSGSHPVATRDVGDNVVGTCVTA